MLRKTTETDAFWQTFRKRAGLSEEADYVVVSFGNSPAMADELAALVVAGTKRATASLARDYDDGREPLPAVGDYVVVVDSEYTPHCIWRTTEIELKPLSSVDESFAWDEGEGDRTRTWWLRAHNKYFDRQAAREGFAMHDDIMTVFEQFEIVWPPEIADKV